MSSNALHNSLLRPPVLHILRAAGFNATRPAALDTLVDLATRYISLLATTVASRAYSNHNEVTPTITDLRMALQDIGALGPQIGAMEEQCRGEEDTRGVDGFVEWLKGPANREIRRIAGLAATEGEVVDVEAGAEREDFLTGTFFHKTGEESRYQGTVLGKSADEKIIIIEGGHTESIEGWEAKLRERGRTLKPDSNRNMSSAPISSVSSPLSEI
ncbi:MAG: hypothetical protein Q9187_007500 [Circinaria calcarea]